MTHITSVKYNLISFHWILRRNMKLEGGYLLSHVYVIYTRQNSLCVLIAHDYEFTSMEIYESFTLKRSTRLRGSTCNNKKTRADQKGYLFTINRCLLRNKPLLLTPNIFLFIRILRNQGVLIRNLRNPADRYISFI